MPEAENRAQQFIDALQSAEKTKDTGALENMFAADAQVSSISLHRPHEGAEGVRQFWSDYLAAFKNIASEFNHIHASGDLAVLEWKSTGNLPSGEAIVYQGVSILEYAGDKIARFRTYYDSAAFLPDGAKLLGRKLV